MSQENVEIVRRWLEGLPEDPEDFPAYVAELWEADGDYYPVRSFPEARPCHGREEIVRFGVELIPAWSEYRYVVKDARAIGDDRVFAQAELHAAGSASGVALEGEAYHCCWLRHGRFIRVEDHLTEKGGLHALGLSGETLEGAGLTE
jgi:hypothetical protein